MPFRLAEKTTIQGLWSPIMGLTDVRRVALKRRSVGRRDERVSKKLHIIEGK
jgi:hypothetical protein